MLRKVLIANRGEIACRVARTCRRLGIEAVGVHSTADRNARHVREIGNSVEIGGAAPGESYLNIAAIAAAAESVGADAIHPGYGFLSENPDFVRALDAAGIGFLGPRPETLEQLGLKDAAKQKAAELGIPVVPGSEQAFEDVDTITAQVEQVGLPALLKAAAGGGGRGMRRVGAEDDLRAAIEAAMREAQGAFGSSALLVERCLEKARHIEVQIAGDGEGQVMHFFERECSLQRRHQKVIEEAPAVNLAPGLRDRILADACTLAGGLAYRGVGTVEFIVTGDEHFFLEVTPRLQVEHPVTEQVTGVDLVEVQLRIAAGLGLPEAPEAPRGHSIEARIYAEDTTAGFLPSTGTVEHLRLPVGQTRVEPGVDEGDVVTPYYDSMIAKLITTGGDRDAALTRMLDALTQSHVSGVTTNIGFLSDLLDRAEVRAGAFHTGSIDTMDLSHGEESTAELAAVAGLLWLHERREPGGVGPWTAWDGFTNYRLAADPAAVSPVPSMVLHGEGGEWPVHLSPLDREGGLRLRIGERTWSVGLGRADGSRALVHLDGRSLMAGYRAEYGRVSVDSALGSGEYEVRPYLSLAGMQDADAGALLSPMMGQILKVNVAVGDVVKSGDVVAVLESMKMEMPVQAPFDGEVTAVACAAGDMVEKADLIAEIAAAEEGP